MKIQANLREAYSSDTELRDILHEVIHLTEEVASPRPWKDPIVLAAVAVLVVAALSFYGGFRAAVDRNRNTEAHFRLAVSRACVSYLASLRPPKIPPKIASAFSIAKNCEAIAEQSTIRLRGMATGEVP